MTHGKTCLPVPKFSLLLLFLSCEPFPTLSHILTHFSSTETMIYDLYDFVFFSWSRSSDTSLLHVPFFFTLWLSFCCLEGYHERDGPWTWYFSMVSLDLFCISFSVFQKMIRHRLHLLTIRSMTIWCILISGSRQNVTTSIRFLSSQNGFSITRCSQYTPHKHVDQSLLKVLRWAEQLTEFNANSFS